MMGLSGRVAKLERIQAGILRCAWCRFVLHSTIPTMKQPVANCADKLATKCWFCGTTFIVPLRGLNGNQREVIELIYNSHPTKQFNDERIHAARIWFSLSLEGSEVQRYANEKRELESNSSHHRTQNSASNFGSRGSLEVKAKRKSEELEERAYRFRETQIERFKKLANGPDSFPLDETLERIKSEYPTSGYDTKVGDMIQRLGLENYSTATTHLRSALAVCNLHLRVCKTREVCEIAIWGQSFLETTEETTFFEQESQKAISLWHSGL